MSPTRVRMTSRSSFSAVISVESVSPAGGARCAATSISRLEPLVLLGGPRLVGLHPIDHRRRGASLCPRADREVRAPRRALPSSPCANVLPACRYRLHRAVLAHERGENRVEALPALRRRSACDRRLERQPQRQADFAVRHALALVAIEEPDARPAASPPRRRLNGATNDLGRQGVIDDNREIADDERMARQRRDAVARSPTARVRAASRSISATKIASCRGAPRSSTMAGASVRSRRRRAPPAMTAAA